MGYSSFYQEAKRNMKPKIRYGVVAYMDFLGSKQRILESDESNNSMLLDVMDIYDIALKELETHNEYYHKKIQYKVFFG